MFSDACRITRSLLLGCAQTSCHLDKHVCDVVNQLKLRRRGCRSGAHVRRRQLSGKFYPSVPTTTWGIPTVMGRRNVIVDKQKSKHSHNVTRRSEGRPEDKGQCGSSEFRRSVLSAVPKAEIVSPPFKVGVFNAQSVANKSASVCHWIAHNDLHIAAVVETWHDGNDSPSLVACTPPGYRYVERTRPRVDDLRPLNTNHGGVCLFHKGNMHVRPITLPS